MTEWLEPLRCATCGGALSGRDVHRALGVATCPTCQTVLALPRPAPLATGPTHGALLPVPERFQVTEAPGALRIEWKWFRPAVLFQFVFCLVWDGFLVVWYRSALREGQWGMALFTVLHVALGMGLTYSVLASFFNRTVIEARAGGLSISHGPVPWRGARVPREALAQLYVEEKVTRGKGGTSATWGLSAVLRDGRRLPLLKRLEEKAEALYLERTLEARFAIEDRRVLGEAR